MNIQPGDWVALTGEGFKENRFKIKKVSRLFGYSKCDIFFEDDDACYGVYYNGKGYSGYEIQRIQDYFEPGDEVEVTFTDDFLTRAIIGSKMTEIVKRTDGHRVFFESLNVINIQSDSFKNNIKSIRNLTKEGKMKEVKKEKPTHLTVDDLYLTAKTPACKMTRISFIENFGFDVPLTALCLKEWIKERNLEKDFQDNLPEHYAVIFDTWQPKINEIVWVQASHEWIGRYTRKTCDDKTGKEMYQITGQWGDVYWLEIDQIKPISERPFQVGDCIKGKLTGKIFEVIVDKAENTDTYQLHVSRANELKDKYDLIISPAIPEVK